MMPPFNNPFAAVASQLDRSRPDGHGSQRGDWKVRYRFIVGSTDASGGWYFRSDHVPYAERSVPSIFFSTNLHSDYHTPRDEPKNIEYLKLTRMTQWMYTTGWIAGNAARRPAVDAGFVLR